MMTLENTTGYAQDEIAAINERWMAIVERDGLEEYTEEYYAAEKAFFDKAEAWVETVEIQGEADNKKAMFLRVSVAGSKNGSSYMLRPEELTNILTDLQEDYQCAGDGYTVKPIPMTEAEFRTLGEFYGF